MESSDKFFIEFTYHHKNHEDAITALLSDFVDFLEDDFELYIYKNSMILIFKNLFCIYEIHHKLNIIQKKPYCALQFHTIKIIDYYLENVEYPEFKLKVKEGFFVEKLKRERYLMQEF